MRIGIDFDNTIICYDVVFREVAKSWQMIDTHFHGNKRQLRELIQASPVGDLGWQRLQGKVYGKFIHQAVLFPGFKEFILTCKMHPKVEVFIVSHKTEFGHFDEDHVNLREASRQWLYQQGFFHAEKFGLEESHVFFETTREAKIERIKKLQCTHFIDDLIEVLDSPLFPQSVERILFQASTELENIRPAGLSTKDQTPFQTFNNWVDIKNAIFS